MSNWVSESEITTKLGYKILISGLSEAGKTAVKRIFFLRQHTKDVDRLSATINYERMSISIKGTPITIVDLGGQKVFVKRFLSGFSPFIFSSVKIFIFLIDVANKTTRNNAIQYFTACYENLQKYSPNAKLFVFLHKNDLVRNSPNYESIHEQLKEQFQLECPTTELSFFRTTIYRPESVIDAFGRIFELTIPNLANSELVEGRTIGRIEEYSKEDMTLRKPVKEEVKPVSMTRSLLKTAGDPEILQKLHTLMQQAIQSQSTDGISSENQVIGEEEVIEEVYSKHLEELSLGKEIVPTPGESSSQTISPTLFETSTPDDRINHLINFYNINLNQATRIVDLGYDYVFELSATSGIRIPIVLKVLLKYIPFLKSKGLKVDALYHDRILDIFAAYLEGGITETDLIKFLIYAIERPMMPVKEIVNRYFIMPKKEMIISQDKMTSPVTKRKYASIQIPIKIQTKVSDGVISLPAIKDLGVMAEIIEFNSHLTFYTENKLINSSMVPTTIAIDEIMYLLTFEMNLQALGYFKDGLKSTVIAARIIYEILQKLRKDELSNTNKIESVGNSIELVVLLDIQVEGDQFLLLDSDDTSFKIINTEQGVLIQFFKSNEAIFAITLDTLVNLPELILKLNDISLGNISSDTIDLVARIIISLIENQYASFFS